MTPGNCGIIGPVNRQVPLSSNNNVHVNKEMY